MSSRFLKSLGVALAVCLLVGSPWEANMFAQSITADIVGTVTDSTGAIVPNAKVTVQNTGTHDTRVVTSNGSGDFTVNQLLPGPYSVTVEAPGFKTFSIPSLVLSTGDRARANAQMQVGSQGERVEVTAQTPALQTDSSTLTNTLGETSVQELPLNGRNYVTLVQTTPGANSGPPDSTLSGTKPDDRRQTGAVSANGQPESRNNNMIDGMDNNEREQGLVLVRPSIDEIQEISVTTNSYTADLGNTSGAVINIITKSGTNKFHGGLYEYLRNDILDANEYYNKAANNPRPKYRQNQFGGSIGGPVLKDKLFFFFDYEDLRIVQGVSSGLQTVPTLYERQHPGDLTDYCNGLTDGTAAKALTTCLNQHPIIPAANIDKIGLGYFNLYPLPNFAGSNPLVSNFVASNNRTQTAETIDARADYHLTGNDSLFVRYSYNPVTTFTPGYFPAVNGIQPGGGSYPGPANETAQGLAIHYLHTFNQNLIMELGAGYSRLNLFSSFINQGNMASTKLGIPNVNIDSNTTGLMPVSISGFTTLGDNTFLPIVDINNVFQYQGTLTYTHGAHNFKFGGSWIRRQLQYFQENAGEGTFTFAGTFPNGPVTATSANGPSAGLMNLLSGTPQQITRQNPSGLRFGYRVANPDLFVMDDWHATKRLTINAGLRWEYDSPITEVNNKRSNFLLSGPNALTFDQAHDGDRTAGVHPDWINFAPRLGFALALDHNLVVRGGAGISYYGFTGPQPTKLVNAPNYFNFSCLPGTLTGGNACPAGIGTLAQGPPLPVFGQNTVLNPTGTVNSMDPNYRLAYIQQFNLTVQKAVGPNVFTASYLGELGRRDGSLVPANTPLPNPGKALPYIYAKQLPNVSTITYYTSEGYSNYNAAMFVFERRYSRGLTLNANYTWARGLNNTQDSGQGGTFGLVANDPRYDYGNSDIDRRNRATITGTYAPTYGQHFAGWKKQAIAGWQANTLFYIQTGAPIQAIGSGTNSPALINLPGINSDRPSTNPGQPLRQPHPTLDHWLNAAGLTPQLIGTAGNLHRNQAYGPTQRQLDFSVSKNFPIHDQVQLQFRAESFNLTNTPNFANPNATVSAWTVPSTPANPQPSGTVSTTNGSYGRISSTLIGSFPRNLQFALRLTF